MRNRIIFCVVAMCAFGLVFYFDSWGQKAFVNMVLSSGAPKRQFLVRNGSHAGFPATFMIGASSSAYQIEGGWNESGKTPSIWDDFVHFRPSSVVDNSTADVGPDSFHNFREDVAALKLVGVNMIFDKSASMTHFCIFSSTQSFSTIGFPCHGRESFRASDQSISKAFTTTRS